MVSHLKERKEKCCLNCNAIVHGKFCSICGQENLEPQESTGHLISHFFQDITHFDGKFFSSLKYLVLKPGFLTAEYVTGRRASYLNPVRMYVFTSFIFFLIFFAMSTGKKSNNNEYYNTNEKEQLAKEDSVKTADSLIVEGLPTEKKDLIKKQMLINNEDEPYYETIKQYDSLLAEGKIKHNGITQFFVRKNLEYKKKYGTNRKMANVLKEEFIHIIPQMLIISLPLLALFLKLLYSRKLKLYYVAHAVFSIQLYIFFYIAILVSVFAEKIAALPYLGWFHLISIFCVLYIFYYIYKAMRNFYQQGRLKTILKYFLVFIWMVFISVIVTLIGGLITFLKL